MPYENATSHRADEPNNEAQGRGSTDSPSSIWQELQSYLSLDFTVEHTEEFRTGDHLVDVTITVTNTAPLGDGRPEVVFNGVTLETARATGTRQDNLGRLEPGESVARTTKLMSRQLASVDFRVRGAIDRQLFFTVRRSSGLPSEVTAPLTEEFVMRFRNLDFREPLSAALASVESLSEATRLSQAATIRETLAKIRTAVESKTAALQELFREFHLTEGTQLGKVCLDVFQRLRELSRHVEAVDAAIVGTAPSAIIDAVRGMEQLELAMLQLEETTSRYARVE
jgi:ribosomal protein L19